MFRHPKIHPGDYWRDRESSIRQHRPSNQSDARVRRTGEAVILRIPCISPPLRLHDVGSWPFAAQSLG